VPWRDYLCTPGRLHFSLWSHRFLTGNALFPGVTAITLAGLAIARGTAWRDRRARMALAVGIAGVLLSCGAALPGYATLYAAVPLLKGIRVVARFGYLAILAIAILAGFGLAEFRRTARARSRRLVSTAAFALAVVEPLAIPISYERAVPIPRIYARLAAERDAVVVELPMHSGGAIYHNARYMLNSTAHWQPLVNGYSGFVPGSFGTHLQMLAAFPKPECLAALREAGVTHVVVHRREIEPPMLDAVSRSPGLQTIADDGAITLYRLARPR
jgi:hypothetical protein